MGIFVSLESCRCPAQHEGKKATFKSDTVATVTLIFAFLDILQFGFASGEKLENDIFKAISSYVRGCMLEVSVHKGTDNVLARLNPCPQRLRMGREMENFGPLCVCVRVFVCVCVCVCVCVGCTQTRVRILNTSNLFQVVVRIFAIPGDVGEGFKSHFETPRELIQTATQLAGF